MTEEQTIDTIDFSILTAIETADRALWKNKIHETLETEQQRFPIASTPSVQTVGRRIDQLNDDGYVENVISSPQELKRDLIISFKLTEQGKDAISEKRQHILRNLAEEALFSQEKTTDIGKEAIATMITNTFEDTPFSQDPTQHTEAELLTLLTLHYVESEAMEVFSSQDKQELRETLSQLMTEPETEPSKKLAQ